MANEITSAEAAEWFSYDANSGLVIWKKSPRIGVMKGDKAGFLKKDGYMAVKLKGKQYQMHRVVWLLLNGVWPDGDIDHIDGNRANNKADNLRDVTRRINSQNRRGVRKTGTKSGLLGCSYLRGKWQATINVNGKTQYLGVFSSPEEAHSAYLNAKRQLHAGCTI